MVRIGPDLLVLGGNTYSSIESNSIYRLSCTNIQCKWETLSQRLSIPRVSFVAIPVPDDFTNCLGEQKIK